MILRGQTCSPQALKKKKNTETEGRISKLHKERDKKRRTHSASKTTLGKLANGADIAEYCRGKMRAG